MTKTELKEQLIKEQMLINHIARLMQNGLNYRNWDKISDHIIDRQIDLTRDDCEE
jgi:hypothetical protein